MKILIVEDNPDMVDMLQTLLEHQGYDYIVAKNGKEAVDMAASQLPDLVLLDIMLPNMDGLEAARLIRQNPKTCSTPILAVTAKVFPEDREECFKSGCNDYLSKPFTPKELVSCIEKLLA
ncbi:MAG: response regulator [Candidatus Binatia bacterium]